MNTENSPTTDDDVQTHRLASRLRFRHAQLLVTLRDTGSLHAAAQVLHLTQPALSKMLREVEQAFGQQLFDRSARGLKPTAAGNTATHGARLLLEELKRLSRELAVRPPSMVLRVGIPPFVALSLMPAVLTKLRATSDDIRVELTEGGVPGLVRLLLDGKLDALVTSFVSDLSEAAAAGATFERLYSTRIAVVAAASHPLANKRRVPWSLLADEPWILPPRDSRVRRAIDDMFAEAGLLAPPPVIESANPVTNLLFASKGLGIAAVPQECLGLMEQAKAVVKLRLQKHLPEGVVTLAYRGGNEHPRLRLFREALLRTG